MKLTLIRAKAEINRLRRQNEILQAKVEVMDLFACVLHTQPATRNQVESPDILWEIDQGIDRLQAMENEGTTVPIL